VEFKQARGFEEQGELSDGLLALDGTQGLLRSDAGDLGVDVPPTEQLVRDIAAGVIHDHA